MAYVTEGNYGYGDGLNNDVTNPTGQINSYANITAYTVNTVTIGTPSNGAYEKFEVGREIMIHVSATNGTSQEYAYLGKYEIARITAVSGNVLTIDKDFTKKMPVGEFAKYQVQAIAIAKFRNLGLTRTTITPIPYSVTNKYGGILLIKCSEKLSFSGGNISLLDKGIPIANAAYRPLTTQEQVGKGNADTDKYSAWENHITIRDFLLNAGDGALMLWAKTFSQLSGLSRIGGNTAGSHFKRGDKGGSSIAIICDEWVGFNPVIISKNKNSGQGLGRCYIATNTKLRNDEGLYAYDCISNPLRLIKNINISGYGSGILGNVTNPNLPINNYARVTKISADGKTIEYTAKTSNGMAQIGVGNKIMFHISKHLNSNNMSLLGKFIIVNILADDGNKITTKESISNIINPEQLSSYNCQIISIAEFNNLTISIDYNKTPGWNDVLKIGGICALMAKGICDFRKGKINVQNKGGGNAYAKEGLQFIGNAQMNDIFPLGQGHGSVFISTNECLMDEETRIGAIYHGHVFGGYGGGESDYDEIPDSNNKGYIGLQNSALSPTGGIYEGGKGTESIIGYGGYGGNGFIKDVRHGHHGHHGSHIMLIINHLNLFNMVNVSTGGQGGYHEMESYRNGLGGNAGCGYGGGGGGWDMRAGEGAYNAGGGGANVGSTGGGSSGWMFLYINRIDDIKVTGVIAE